MKTCVFITGTHAVGKSSLAWAIIDRYGGVDRITNDVTYCKNGSVSLAGKYGVTRYGGVDRISNDKGASCTSRLAEVVEEALNHSDICFCEGSFMNTFGMNLVNALFKAQSYLVVSLYADGMTIYNRLKERSEGKNGKRNFELILKKQKQAMIAARKWHEIGVPVLQVNTAENTTEALTNMVISKINSLCGQGTTTR
jgi:serine kinase of HPr protein (carbohydrate metabolism regulator)